MTSAHLDDQLLRSTGTGTRLQLLILVIAAFTPYLGIGINIRYEHIIVYSLMLLLLVGVIGGRRLNLNFHAKRLMGSWLLLGSLIVVNTYLNARSGVRTVDPLAIADGFLLPTALFLLAYKIAVSSHLTLTRLLELVCGAVILMLSLNSLLILLFDPAEITDLLRRFWSNPATTSRGGSVAEMALRGGRYGGIFNQPFDGGVAYTLGVVSWLYRFRLAGKATVFTQVVGLVSLALLVAGGVSTQSKVFPYGSLIVLALTLIISGRGSINRLIRFLRQLALVGLALLTAGWLGFVESFDRTIGTITSVQERPDERYSGLYAATGGRTESTGDYVDLLWSSVSLSGNGWVGAQDDAILAYLRGAGLLGLSLFLIVIFSLTTIALRLPIKSPERLFGITLVVVMTMASFGAVSFHTNRGSSIFWILFGIIAAGASGRRHLIPKQASPPVTLWPPVEQVRPN